MLVCENPTSSEVVHLVDVPLCSSVLVSVPISPFVWENTVSVREHKKVRGIFTLPAVISAVVRSLFDSGTSARSAIADHRSAQQSVFARVDARQVWTIASAVS